jgi:hypothetical protein
MYKPIQIVSVLIIVILMAVVLWQVTQNYFGETHSNGYDVGTISEKFDCPFGFGEECHDSDCDESEKGEKRHLAAHFQAAIEQLSTDESIEPIEGYEPDLLMQLMPGLEEADFNGVEAIKGQYAFSEGELTYVPGEEDIMTSADQSISHKGMRTLLNNVSDRLGMTFETLEVDAVMAELTGQPYVDFPDLPQLPTTPPTPGGEPEPVACTMDAKQCPDGSFVGRVGPDCEFAPCPDSEFPIRYGEDASRMEEFRSDCEQRMGVFNECASACDDLGEGMDCPAVCSMVCSGPASEHFPQMQ